MTADFRPIAGPLPRAEGAWVITGDCECGVTHGPGLAKTLAELVLGLETSLADPAPLDPGRFDPAIQTGADVLRAMAEAEGGVWKLESVEPGAAAP
jgi:hypothetical protein